MHLFLLIYFVMFADKPQNAAPALSEAAIVRRERFGIALDALDLPVSSAYTDSLQQAGAVIHHRSRWMNGVTCEMDSATAATVAGWPFVSSVECTRDSSYPWVRGKRRHLSPSNEGQPWESRSTTYNQLATYNLHPLHQLGYLGQGITMAVCDGGFLNADEADYLDHSKLLGWYDFTDDARYSAGELTPEEDFFGETGEHGTICLGTIAALTDTYEGAAPDATYYLMRSEEMNTESPKEMDNLVAALECADSLGVDIFSVSLGYAYFDNTDWSLSKSAMDGKTTRCSRAALIAARKGMLVVVSSGNEGDSEWQTVSAPADADSILTVGAVDTLRNIASFSSYGITTDGRIKPDVCAVGKRTTLISPWSGEVFNGNGTSFATPLMAGMAACIWSALPDEDAMSIRQRIITSADRYTQPEERYGYGIPDAYAAYSNILGITNASESKTATKSIRDNRLLILQNGTWYDVLGRAVRNSQN